MHDIKFRAWDIQQNRMLEWDELKNEPAILTEVLENRYPYFKPIMQFTGLRDKNGVEIYEGDIIKWGHIKVGEEEPIRIAVVELNPDIQFKCLNLGDVFHYGNFAYKDTEKYVEKIGDIYRNKELLGGNK